MILDALYKIFFDNKSKCFYIFAYFEKKNTLQVTFVQIYEFSRNTIVLNFFFVCDSNFTYYFQNT